MTYAQAQRKHKAKQEWNVETRDERRAEMARRQLAYMLDTQADAIVEAWGNALASFFQCAADGAKAMADRAREGRR